MFALRTIEQGWGVRARWQNFSTRIPRLWLQYQFLWYTNWLWWKNRFSPLLAPLCPCETLSPVGSRGAKFECPLWWAGFDAGCSELGSIPVSCKKIIVFDEKIFCFNLLSVRAVRKVLVDFRVIGFRFFCLNGLGSIPALPNAFFSFLLEKKNLFVPSSFLSARNGKSY